MGGPLCRPAPRRRQGMLHPMDDDEFEDADELVVDAAWEPVAVADRLDLDEQWVTYLAAADPPANVDGVDLSAPDFERSEVGYA